MSDEWGTSDPAVPEPPASGANRLFDLRYLIGALFSFYGVLLTVASFFVSHTRSGSVDIDLWLGLGMLVLGVFFLVWAWWRPLHVGEESAAARAERAGS
jgi:hypothetical protein